MLQTKQNPGRLAGRLGANFGALLNTRDHSTRWPRGVQLCRPKPMAKVAFILAHGLSVGWIVNAARRWLAIGCQGNTWLRSARQALAAIVGDGGNA